MENKMKPISLEDLARLLGPRREKKPTETAVDTTDEHLGKENNTMQGSIPLEALALLSGPIPEKKPTKYAEASSEDTKPRTSHIVDITDQFLGKSLIITGARPPKKTPAEREESLRKATETATEKPPEK
jgi:hypothetical protein